jgi:hypothetical protein
MPESILLNRLHKNNSMIIRFKLVFLITFFSVAANAQKDQWLRAFPITSYIVEGNDSVNIVQLEMPDGIILKDKQMGLIQGVYESRHSDTVRKGYGRCNLIKGNFYYFAIVNNKSGEPLKGGDLLYTLMEKTSIYYNQVAKLAGHFIRLQTVYEESFYDRYLLFNNWTADDEKKLIDSVIADIRFTGRYFQENDPSIDKDILTGEYKGQKVLSVMARCQSKDVIDFFDYIIARPRLYAGKAWKVSEIFATWVSEGAPSVIK